MFYWIIECDPALGERPIVFAFCSDRKKYNLYPKFILSSYKHNITEQLYHVIISGILFLVVNTLQEFAFKILVYLLVSCKQLLALNITILNCTKSKIGVVKLTIHKGENQRS